MRLRVADVDDEEHGADYARGAMPTVLYAIPASHPCAAVEAALRREGRAVRARRPPAAASARLAQRRRFGRGTVPGVVFADGVRVSGSRAIMRALDERVPQPPLLPPAGDERRPAVERAATWGEEVLQPLARRLIWAALRRRPGADALLRRPRQAAAAAPAGAARRAARRPRRAGGPPRGRPRRAGRPASTWTRTCGASRTGWRTARSAASAPNAADLQIAASLRLLLTVEDLAAALDAPPRRRARAALVPRLPRPRAGRRAARGLAAPRPERSDPQRRPGGPHLLPRAEPGERAGRRPVARDRQLRRRARAAGRARSAASSTCSCGRLEAVGAVDLRRPAAGRRRRSGAGRGARRPAPAPAPARPPCRRPAAPPAPSAGADAQAGVEERALVEHLAHRLRLVDGGGGEHVDAVRRAGRRRRPAGAPAGRRRSSPARGSPCPGHRLPRAGRAGATARAAARPGVHSSPSSSHTPPTASRVAKRARTCCSGARPGGGSGRRMWIVRSSVGRGQEPPGGGEGGGRPRVRHGRDERGVERARRRRARASRRSPARPARRREAPSACRSSP